MVIAIDLPPSQAEKLRDEAHRLGVEPQELALAAVRDFIARPESDFEAAAAYVLDKNRELYRRLA